MTAYDIFNGDADGICSLLQLRLAGPRRATLVTGVKRDINLLEKINPKAGDAITVLDISMRSNASGLSKALKAGAHVFYVDHHNAGNIPIHENLFAVIDTRPKICTSLLVNKCLNGAYAEWAVVGAFGDNLQASAQKLAKSCGLPRAYIRKLENFGTLLNYNGYGQAVSDLHFAPKQLYQSLLAYRTPAECFEKNPDIYKQLKTGFEADFGNAKKIVPIEPNIVLLNDAPWARRISGSYGNNLAQQNPAKAHAVITYNANGGYLVSVRAPLENPHGADVLCLKFPSGGGRAAAAGINHLPKHQFDSFMKAFAAHLWI